MRVIRSPGYFHDGHGHGNEYEYGDDYEDGEEYDWSQRENPCNGAFYSSYSNSVSRNILASDIGLTLKQSNDGSLFVAATNLNKVVPEYLEGSEFNAMASIQTVSNSMDVGNPSNFPRLIALYGGDENLLKENVDGFFYDDDQTIEAIRFRNDEMAHLPKHLVHSVQQKNHLL